MSRPQAVHDNSIQAYRSQEAKLSRRAAAVLDWIAAHGPRTDREIAYGMGFGENLNAVRPRITELIDANKLMEVCNVRCPVTRKTVRKVDVRGQRDLFGLAQDALKAQRRAAVDVACGVGK